VVELYHEYIGGYRVPPLWYFGFHQSRWGYKDAKKMSDVVSGYNSSKLKLESVFLDIDYMKDKKPFTVDTANFPFDELLKLKKRTEIKLIPIVDYAFNYDF
jgi:alpha-glucosidase (family GH31 glycosyl hydrolase)